MADSIVNRPNLPQFPHDEPEITLVPTSNLPVIVDYVQPALTPLDLERLTNTLLKNVAESSRRIYQTDVYQFFKWLAENHFNLATVEYSDLSEYRAYLGSRYQKPTATRKLVVMRRLLEVAVLLKLRPDNPATALKGYGTTANETTRRALTKKEASDLLASIDQTTAKGKRDYALFLLLLRTGIRRAEAAGLTIGDLSTEGGYPIATIRHGKGDKRRIVKLPSAVRDAIERYLAATGQRQGGPQMPLFARFTRADKPKQAGLDGRDIERIVEGYAARCGLDRLTPHGLRASFVTLALEGGARLQQVQYAAGHADPRTTERYQKRKQNLQDNAVDYLDLG
ncbi:MAG: hypothetical protein BGO39_21230 [Chloroflexi bacterium 54-19]|nr:MAG: hypothetical protein BGO39_21230 [Chloroflexi bacterium 54-19]